MVGLGEAIDALRAEIVGAMTGSANEPVRFRVDSLELELQVTATESEGLDGGVKFWLFSAGGSKNSDSAVVHKVTLQLTAVTAGGGEVLTSDDTDETPL